jgi:exopolyphosphatase/guanosine-5'-triphosphate,3'-diphosphate pyrophosphatase
VDLGSNSFHMVVAEETEGQPNLVDRLRERVGLLEGLEADGGIDPEVEVRALDCLARFRQRLSGLPAERVRAVGTATFRRVRDQGQFQMRAEAALGQAIEILPGREEARLVFLGVAHSLGHSAGRRLVVDIGGGSTEVIIGERFESEAEKSLSMGCVSWTERFFKKGRLTVKAFARAELAARVELEPVSAKLRARGWNQAVGSSGTILAVSGILKAQGWTDGTITSECLERLVQAMLAVGSSDELRFSGLKPDRRPVLAAGVAILRAVFAGLDVESMLPSQGALREGLLYDLLGRLGHDDVRSQAVLAFGARMGIDEARAGGVRAAALALFDQVQGAWSLGPGHRDLLSWAAWLHGVGLAMSYSGYHRHGAYMVAHADLPGFSREDRKRLAALVLSHRRRPKLEAYGPFEGSWQRVLPRLTLLLRVAVRLCRSGAAVPESIPVARAQGVRLQLAFSDGWLDAHPMTESDLEAEVDLVRALGLELDVS